MSQNLFRRNFANLRLFTALTDKNPSRYYSTSFAIKHNETVNRIQNIQKTAFRVSVNAPPASSSLVLFRNISSSSQVLSSDNKGAGNINDFRAREEQKEADFNKSSATEPNPSNEAAVEEEEEIDESTEAIKKKIAQAALAFVEVDGWSRKALTKGAESAGYPGISHGMFASGGIDLIHYYYLQCNENLVEQMKTKTSGIDKIPNPKEFVSWAIKTRLSMVIPYIKTWPQAQAMMALPPNVPKSLANLLTLVDDICYFTGDRSVDLNWYARRVGIASIYKATELYMLQDSSTDYENTWKFLDRRIEDASVVHELLVQSGEATQNLQNAVSSAFVTARNILGLNYNRR